MEIHAKKNTAKLIGLTGYATAGKDAFADCLVQEYGYVKLSWADKLYDMALDINPLFWHGWRPRSMQWLVSKLGWTEAKRISSVRQYLQWLGTEIIRYHLGADTWIKATMPVVREHLNNGRSVVITNCRFKNEAKAIEDAGGCLVLVERPGTGPVNDHVSDSGEVFQMAAFRVLNDKDYANLTEWAHALEAAVGGVHPNPEMNMIPFVKAIKKGITSGVQLVLSTAAPASEVTETWMERHKVECALIDEGIEVFVDGRSAGRVRYSDNILEVDAKISR